MIQCIDHDTETDDEGARPASRLVSSSDVGDGVAPGVSSSGAPMTSGEPLINYNIVATGETQILGLSSTVQTDLLQSFFS